MTNPQYPINLIVEDRPCLVVGGGDVALRKVRELVKCGAHVTVIAPEICRGLEAFEKEGNVGVERRSFDESDLDRVDIVVAATDDVEVNRRVSKRARSVRALVNVVDQPDLCQFTAPAVVRRGSLTIAISTNGGSPALSKHLRRELSKEFGAEWSDVVAAMGSFRARLLERSGDTFERRRELMERACDLDLAGIARSVGLEGLEARLFELLEEEISSGVASRSASRRVYLVGAGPGDPELLTLKGARLLGEAGAVVYDALVSQDILDLISPEAERCFVGKRGGRHFVPQEETNDLLVELAGRYDLVVRLKGGDPYLFGRGAEEEAYLIARGIDVQVVPGVTSAIAAPAAAGIPLTHRDHASAVVIATGHRRSDREGAEPVDWEKLGSLDATISILMGVKNLEEIVGGLQAGGRPPNTPVALVQWGTTEKQRELITTLDKIVVSARDAGFGPPSVLVVGTVVHQISRNRGEGGGQEL